MHRKRNRKDTRDKNQVHDRKGEAQNVNVDPSPGQLGGTDKNIAEGRSKANEGIKQVRDRQQEGWNRTSEQMKDEAENE